VSLARRVCAEGVGTGLLVTIVVGSGIAAQRLSADPGLQLLENSLATAAGLAVLILMLGPVSGAHFNPIVTGADWLLGGVRRRTGRDRGTTGGLPAGEAMAYVGAQVTGAVAGAVLADAMFGVPLVQWSGHTRTGGALWLGEVVATAGLLLVILALARTGRAGHAPWAVGAYIGAAYWFTSSTSFANPAVTVGRAFTDTFAGIAPSSVPPFVVAQLIGGVVALVLAAMLYPDVPVAAGHVILPHDEQPDFAST
jgi:glycerol uptake facilitator-like aquaporin